MAERLRTLTLLSLSDIDVPPVGVQAMPARINAPDSRFMAERLRTLTLLSLSDFDAPPVGVQAMLSQERGMTLPPVFRRRKRTIAAQLALFATAGTDRHPMLIFQCFGRLAHYRN